MSTLNKNVRMNLVDKHELLWHVTKQHRPYLNTLLQGLQQGTVTTINTVYL